MIFGGFTINVVEPGTEITNAATGKKLTVTDTEMVTMRSAIYMTQRTYDAIKERTAVAPEAP